jgi:TolA-binding protein
MSKRIAVLLILAAGLLLYGCAMKGIVFQNAESAYAERDYARAKELFLEVVEKYPNSDFASQSRFRLAQIYAKEHSWDESINYYEMVLKDVKGGFLNSQSRTEVARIRRARKDIADAKFIYDNNPGTATGNENAANALYKMAQAYERLEEYELAIETYEKLVKEFPDFEKIAQAQNQIGYIYFYRMYDYVKGWDAYQKVIKGYPGTDMANQAEVLLKQTERTLNQIQGHQAAIDQIAKKLAFEFENKGRHVTQHDKYGAKADMVAQEYTGLAVAWERLKNYPNAIQAYKELAAELPFEQAAPSALFKTAELYQEMGDYESAVKAYDNLFSRYPQSIRRADAVYNQATCYESMREFEKAFELYKAYVSLDETEDKTRRAAEDKVAQMGYDGDGDGFAFYQEAQYDTSDSDPTSYPER